MSLALLNFVRYIIDSGTMVILEFGSSTSLLLLLCEIQPPKL